MVKKTDLAIGQVYGGSRVKDFSAPPVRLVHTGAWGWRGGKLTLAREGEIRTGVLAVRSCRRPRSDGSWEEHVGDLLQLTVPVPGLLNGQGRPDPEVLSRLRIHTRSLGLRLVIENSARWSGVWEAYAQLRRNFLTDKAVQEARANAFRASQEAKKAKVEHMLAELGVRVSLRWRSKAVEIPPHVHGQAVSHAEMDLDDLLRMLSDLME